MVKLDLEAIMKEKYPHLLEKENSIQKKISIELLDLRLDNKISFRDFSAKLGLSEDEYIKYEFGDNDLSVEQFKLVLKKAKEIVKNGLSLSEDNLVKSKVIVVDYSFIKNEKKNIGINRSRWLHPNLRKKDSRDEKVGFYKINIAKYKKEDRSLDRDVFYSGNSNDIKRNFVNKREVFVHG